MCTFFSHYYPHHMYVNVSAKLTPIIYFICNNYIWSNTHVHCSGKKYSNFLNHENENIIYENLHMYIFSVFDYKRVLQNKKQNPTFYPLFKYFFHQHRNQLRSLYKFWRITTYLIYDLICLIASKTQCTTAV